MITKEQAAKCVADIGARFDEADKLYNSMREAYRSVAGSRLADIVANGVSEIEMKRAADGFKLEASRRLQVYVLEGKIVVHISGAGDENVWLFADGEVKFRVRWGKGFNDLNLNAGVPMDGVIYGRRVSFLEPTFYESLTNEVTSTPRDADKLLVWLERVNCYRTMSLNYAYTLNDVDAVLTCFENIAAKKDAERDARILKAFGLDGEPPKPVTRRFSVEVHELK